MAARLEPEPSPRVWGGRPARYGDPHPEADLRGPGCSLQAGHPEAHVHLYEKKTGKSSVFVGSIERFSGVGRFTKLTWSPDRKWLLVSWPSAGQWVFLEIPGGVRRIDAVGGITGEFDPGAAGGAFPLIEGWCCAG